MATSLKITRIAVSQSLNPTYEHITHIGGDTWKHTVSEAISNIDKGIYTYYVSVNSRSVNVIVVTRNGKKYLRTESDGYYDNNLLSLPRI